MRSALLSGAEDLIRQLGAKPATIARRAGVPMQALRDPDIPLRGRSAYAFLEIAADHCGCATFGLRLGRRAPLAATIGPLWVLVRQAPTLRQMLGLLADNFDVYTSVASVAIETLRDGLIVRWSSTAGHADSEVQMAEFAIAVMVQEVRRLAEPRWEPRSVEFRHAPPADLSDHRALFGSSMGFNRDHNAVFMERTLADRPLRADDARARALVSPLLRHEEDVLDSSLPARVESVVRSVLPYAPCTLAGVAQALGLRVRTLQHQLDARGDSFKQIKDRVRADLALKYLQHSQLDIGEIAEILGYSEPSALSRSFRRWHGTAPRSVRAAGRA
ncbi:AraC family transcriptional regulator ligand-binding domain-containing protein [Panacagrimonas sp.]|uniref:AraC family transcriptional regulator n=1 Tax=Panacagrimonas sp. TaxID=2480088 RepID=UPI003B521860